MTNTNKKIKLLNYINNPMSNESINVLYDANNIKIERCELYSDFIQSLILLIFDTYMGDDLTDNIQQVKHFEWCWKKNISNFKKEGIDFDNVKLYNYFLEFMLEVYYPLTKKELNQIACKNILNLWLYIFDHKAPKTNSDMDTLIEIYKIFDISFKKM